MGLLLNQMDRAAELRGMYGQTFCCMVEYQDQAVMVVMDCGRPCVDVSHPFVQRLIQEDPWNLPVFLIGIVKIAGEMEREKLEGLCSLQRSGGMSAEIKSAAMRKLPGFVYFLKGENGRYKIGRTKNLKSRMNGIRTSSPVRFEILHSFETANAKAVELFLHDKFDASRAHGEWFDLALDDVEWITGLADFQLDGEVAS